MGFWLIISLAGSYLDFLKKYLTTKATNMSAENLKEDKTEVQIAKSSTLAGIGETPLCFTDCSPGSNVVDNDNDNNNKINWFQLFGDVLQYVRMPSCRTYGTTPPGHSLLFMRRTLENSPLAASDSKGEKRISFSTMATSSADGSDEQDLHNKSRIWFS